jgi:anti-sigma factor RsiW
MKHELQLKIQAWLDGEASDRDTARLAEWIARDAEAGALAAELKSARGAMAGNELPAATPDSREFYWSKIERQIQREASAPRQAPVPWFARWRKFVLPVTGVAALVFVLTFAVRQAQQPTFDEISTTDQGMDAVTFHDQSAGMTVVWLQDNSQQAATEQPSTPKTVPDDTSSDMDTE